MNQLQIEWVIQPLTKSQNGERDQVVVPMIGT